MENKNKSHIVCLLTDIEIKLQELIVETAKSGEYDISRMSSDIAKQIHQMKVAFPADQPAPAASSSLSPAVPQPPDKRTLVSHRKNRYPQYEIRNDTLIRIGWSKKERKEYIHKVTRALFDRTVDAMDFLCRSPKTSIPADKIMDRVVQLGSDPVPSYQIYLVIGCLREFKCVKQCGREGYTATPNLKQSANNLWLKIASDSGSTVFNSIR
jgi:hypothetical protein